jgi:hypothetical protein
MVRLSSSFDRGRERLSRPLPPNRTCGSPASGSPVGGFTHEGTDGPTHNDDASVHAVVGVENKGHSLSSSTFCTKAISSGTVHERWFGVAPGGSFGFSGTFSHRGTDTRFVPSAIRGRCISTFLHPFAPPALPGFPATMSALTPVTGLELAGTAQVSPLKVVWPSKPSVSNHLTASHDRFRTQPFSVMGFPLRRAGPGFAFRSQARQSVRPNRVRVPTDDFFTSCCSPPRLATTQLQSVTGRSGLAWRGLPPFQPDTLTDARPRASRSLMSDSGEVTFALEDARGPEEWI